MGSFFYTLLMIVEVLVAVMLIGIILVQRSKTGGGMGAMAGGSTEAIFGANAGNVLTKTTTWLILTFFSVTILINYMSSQTVASVMDVDADSKVEAPAAKAKTLVEKAKAKTPAAKATTPKAPAAK